MCKECEYRNLEIAFIGYTRDLSNKGLKMFSEDNVEQVEKFIYRKNGSILYLKDGTRIRAIVSYEHSMRGWQFDQLIVFDDSRWKIFIDRAELIKEIVDMTLYISNVPHEFKILKYEHT